MSGDILQYLYGNLKPRRSDFISSNLMSFSQALYVPTATTKEISMAEDGYIYVPTDCKDGKNVCKLIVVFHGCRQPYEYISDTFFTHVGMNEWAESNNIVVIYPQTVKNPEIGNPNACWDWFGYTSNYVFKTGPQMQTIEKMVKSLL